MHPQRRATDKKLMHRILRWISTPNVAAYVILTLGLIGSISLNQYTNDKETKNRRADNTAQKAAIVRSARAVNVKNCNRDFKSMTATRGVLISSKLFTQNAHKEGLVTDANYRRVIAFYDENLANLQLPDCRDSLKEITSDPDFRQKVPTPLYETKKQIPSP